MKLVVVLVSNRPIDVDAYNCIQNLRCSVIAQRDCSEISLARNMALTALCDLQAANQWDCALLVDDDMVFTTEDVKALVSNAMQKGVASSAAYVNADGVTLMAAPWKDGRWLTGLGLLAVPMNLLMALRDSSQQFVNKALQRRAFAFCNAGMVDDVWMSEDFQLCTRLGGVELLPVAVGHIKKRVLKPTHEQVAEFMATKAEG